MWQTLVISTTIICDFTALARAMRSGFDEVERLLQRPAETAARERLTRGVHAFEHRWFDEAREEFQAAVDGFPYWPDAQTLLGVTLAVEGNDEAAVAAFQRAVRYSEGASPSMRRWTATAALLCAGAPTQADQERLSIVRHADLLTGESCPELAWARVILGDRDGGFESRVVVWVTQTQPDRLPEAVAVWAHERAPAGAAEAPAVDTRTLSPSSVSMHEDRIANAHTPEARVRYEAMYERARRGDVQGLHPFADLIALVGERTG